MALITPTEALGISGKLRKLRIEELVDAIDTQLRFDYTGGTVRVPVSKDCSFVLDQVCRMYEQVGWVATPGYEETRMKLLGDVRHSARYNYVDLKAADMSSRETLPGDV